MKIRRTIDIQSFKVNDDKGMYTNFPFKGKFLKDWQKECKNIFSLGELFRMIKDGVDIEKFCS